MVDLNILNEWLEQRVGYTIVVKDLFSHIINVNKSLILQEKVEFITRRHYFTQLYTPLPKDPLISIFSTP